MVSTSDFWGVANKALAAIAAIPLLAACAVSTPFPKLQEVGNEKENEKVVLVLTSISVDAKNPGEFDRQTRNVIDSMASQRGLLGYSARRELFGNEAWTMSVWESDGERANFVRSAVHQDTIAKSASSIVNVQLKRLTLTRKEIPANWASAIELLAEPGNVRTYGQ